MDIERLGNARKGCAGSIGPNDAALKLDRMLLRHGIMVIVMVECDGGRTGLLKKWCSFRFIGKFNRDDGARISERKKGTQKINWETTHPWRAGYRATSYQGAKQ